MRWVSTRVLPEPGTGHDQQRAAAVHDGVELVGVERLEVQRVEIELQTAVVAHGPAHPTEGVSQPRWPSRP